MNIKIFYFAKYLLAQLLVILTISSTLYADDDIEHWCYFSGKGLHCPFGSCYSAEYGGMGYGDSKEQAAGLAKIDCYRDGASSCSLDTCGIIPAGIPEILAKFKSTFDPNYPPHTTVCKARGGAVKITWSIDGVLINEGVSLDLSSYSLNDLHGRTLACQATNKFGQATRSQIIVVKDKNLPPVVTGEIYPNHVEVNSHLYMDCPIAGEDLTYSWYLDDQLLYSDYYFVGHMSGDTPTEAKVICRAENEFGAEEVSTTLYTVPKGALPTRAPIYQAIAFTPKPSPLPTIQELSPSPTPTPSVSGSGSENLLNLKKPKVKLNSNSATISFDIPKGSYTVIAKVTGKKFSKTYRTIKKVLVVKKLKKGSYIVEYSLTNNLGVKTLSSPKKKFKVD